MSANTMDTTPAARRVLGSTGLLVSPLCVGGAEFGSVRVLGYDVPEDRALATLRAVFESPINFLDTGASYGQGESEGRIGMALRELGGLPPGFVLATKADRDPGTGDFSADQVRRSVGRSLRLLGRDRLQLVYLHDPEYAAQSFEQIVGPGGAVDALLGFKSEGIIDHVGIASGPTELIMRYVETDVFEVALSHNRYTLLDRSAQPLFDVACSAWGRGGKCRAVRWRLTGQGAASGTALYVSARQRGPAGASGAYGPGLRSVRHSAGRRRPSVLTPPTAHHIHRRGLQPSGARCANHPAGDYRYSRRAVAGVGHAGGAS